DADVSNAEDAGALFGDERDDMLARALGGIIAEMRAEWRHEISREFYRLKNEFKSLRAQVDADTTNGIEVYCNAFDRRLAVLEAENIKMRALLGAAFQRLGGSKSADILDLPDWRQRHA